jgi:plastocyanin
MSIVSAFGDFVIANGALAPDTQNVVAGDCLSYPSLPNVTDLSFTGTWNATRVVGSWQGNNNTAPTNVIAQLFRFALTGNGFQTVSGEVVVTTTAQLSFSQAFCCGLGCSPTTAATTTAPPVVTTTPPQTNPGLPVNLVVMNQTNPACPQLMLCSVFANNTFVPLVSVFGEFKLTNNITFFVPATVNTSPINQCRTYVTLPGVDPNVLLFSGAWSNVSIAGSWNGPFNMGSNTPPPLTELIHFAVDGGLFGQPRGVRGTIIVTTMSQVQYSADICCGDCSPPPAPACPTEVVVPYARYACTNATSTATLNGLMNHSCLAPNVMFMNPFNVSAPPPTPPAKLAPFVSVSVSAATGFTPRDVAVRFGETVLFTWTDGVNTVTAGSCSVPAPELFHSGSFAFPHSFVVFAGPPLAPNSAYSYFNRANCSQTGSITLIS